MGTEMLSKRLLTLFPITNESLFHEHVEKLDLFEDMMEIVMIEMENSLMKEIVPVFWEPFKLQYATELSKFKAFYKAVLYLHGEYKNLKKIMEKFLSFTCEKTTGYYTRFEGLFKSALLAKIKPDYDGIIYSFYQICFKIFVKCYEENDQDEIMEMLDEQSDCKGCGLMIQACECQQLVNAFTETNLCLHEMNLLDRISGYTLGVLMEEQIKNYVQENCKGNYDESHVFSFEKWLTDIAVKWLIRIFNKGSSKLEPGDSKVSDTINHFHLKLAHYLFQIYANTLIDQFFNIIIEFPDSQPAVDDLKACMGKLDLRSHFVTVLKNSIETRLLHAGVDTSDIITGYVCLIKTMKHLDKSGILLQTVTEPVKEYLKSRQDTVRCVITCLIEETPSNLSEELAKSERTKNEENAGIEEMKDWEKWAPDPIDADAEKNTGNARKSDIISMIVDIYGSKELFVIEYRNLLAERLLSQMDFSPEKEIRNLELLKLRFGETLLHSCEVMLKDISDSKRINSHIQMDVGFNETKKIDVAALIVSSQFWPTFKKETMEFPPAIKEQFENYKKAYESYKGNRTLCWTELNGKVEIEIEINDRIMPMTVTPAQATIILNFQEQREWTLANLSHAMNMPQSVLKRRIGFWQLQGLIKETQENVFVLNDDNKQSEEDVDSRQTVVVEDDEAESAMASASDQREEELQVFWSYILGMLTNLDSMPLERIHTMLKMFASQAHGFEFSQDELKNFLQRKVREHKLIFAYGSYQLPK